VRLAETDRLETFSDGVLSITMTLLVAEIVRPDHASGQLLEKLAAQWASYIAFLPRSAMLELSGSIIGRCSQGCATATAVFTWPTFSFC
jgi:hypothetical protein